MLGFPEGWTEGESRTARLRMLGNAVQVECAELVGRMLLEDALRFAGPGSGVAAATSRLDDSRLRVALTGGPSSSMAESGPLSIDTEEGL